MPDEDKTFIGSLILDLKFWWRPVTHTIHLILDKEEVKCDLLNLDSTFDVRLRRIQISYGFAIHLIRVKGEVKHISNFDSSFDARTVTGVQRHHGLMSKVFKNAMVLYNFETASCLVKGEINLTISCGSSLNALITSVRASPILFLLSNHEQNLMYARPCSIKWRVRLTCAVSFHGDQLQKFRRVLGVSS